MTVWAAFDDRVRRLGLLDLKLAQGAAFFLGLVIAKTVPAVLGVSVWWLAAICLALAVKPTVDFFSPPRR